MRQHRAEALQGARTFDFLNVSKRNEADVDILSRWAKYFEDLDVPYEVVPHRGRLIMYKILHVGFVEKAIGGQA